MTGHGGLWEQQRREIEALRREVAVLQALVDDWAPVLRECRKHQPAAPRVGVDHSHAARVAFQPLDVQLAESPPATD